jgi:N-acetylmuramoyl-L-alanine amidase
MDAGHGGRDNGASYQGRLEKEDNLAMTLAVGRLLQEKGFRVLYTRTEDIYESPSQKARSANEMGGDLFVSIHRNSGEIPGQYTGVETLVYSNQGLPRKVAENVNKNLEQVGYKNIGISERRGLVVLNSTQMPAVLIEVGFINAAVDNRLFDEKFQETAQAIADGIAESF